jgi:hypothetical protein
MLGQGGACGRRGRTTCFPRREKLGSSASWHKASAAGLCQVRRAYQVREDPLDPEPSRQLRRTFDAIRYLEKAVTNASAPDGVVLRYGAFYGLILACSRVPSSIRLFAVEKIESGIDTDRNCGCGTILGRPRSPQVSRKPRSFLRTLPRTCFVPGVHAISGWGCAPRHTCRLTASI